MRPECVGRRLLTCPTSLVDLLYRAGPQRAHPSLAARLCGDCVVLADGVPQEMRQEEDVEESARLRELQAAARRPAPRLEDLGPEAFGLPPDTPWPPEDPSARTHPRARASSASLGPRGRRSCGGRFGMRCSAPPRSRGQAAELWSTPDSIRGRVSAQNFGRIVPRVSRCGTGLKSADTSPLSVG